MEKKADIKFSDLQKIAEFLTEVKPQSHSRIHKEKIIDYVTLLKSFYLDSNTSKSDYLRLKGQKISPTIQFLRKYGFRTRIDLINLNIIFGLILDIILFFFVYPDNFYFLPIVTLFLLIAGLRKLKRIKREGKLLNI